jgi:hypothetical protein
LLKTNLLKAEIEKSTLVQLETASPLTSNARLLCTTIVVRAVGESIVFKAGQRSASRKNKEASGHP